MIQPFFRRLRHVLRPADVRFVYHASYARSVSGVPLDPARADEILAFLLEERLIRRRDISRPVPASLENILRVHSRAYLESLQDPATMTGIFGAPVGDDEVQKILDDERLIVGGTIQATRLALSGRRIAVNLKGGLHHAAPDRGMGFCVFNDIAVAIRRLRARGFADPVLVIDLDLHDGNGTRAAFAEDPTVHTFSIHNAPWDDGPGAATTNVALGSGVTDEMYLDALRKALPPVIEAHRPGTVVYLAGCDPAADDHLGDWKISAQGMLARDQFVVGVWRRAAARRRWVPLVILLGGGYGPSAWRYSARFFAWLLSGRVIEPPDDVEILVRRFRPIARTFTEEIFTREARDAGGDEWGLAESDLADLAPGRAQPTRVLGYYSKHGIELLLERLGFFAKIRALGYKDPWLDVDFTSPLGQTLRVFGDPARSQLLMELRLDRNRRVVRDAEVLYVEWLLLQNPRRTFTPRIAPLPGQQHPGLGMLGDVAAWLIVMCETLGLDGIVFVPAHFYMAVLGQHHMRFLEPRDQARFEALRDALSGVSLGDANRAIEEGRVVDAATAEPVRWEPAPMIVPVSERLRERLRVAGHEDEVRREREQLNFRAI